MTKHSVTITEFNDIGEPHQSFHHQLTDDTKFVISIGKQQYFIDTTTGKVKPYEPEIDIPESKIERNECEKLISQTKSIYKNFHSNNTDVRLFGESELLDLIPKLYAISPFTLVQNPTTLLAYKDGNDKIQTKGFSLSERTLFIVSTGNIIDDLSNLSEIMENTEKKFLDNYLSKSISEYEKLTTDKTPYIHTIQFLIYPEGDKSWLEYRFALIIKGFFRDNELNYLTYKNEN